jgi:hypothetical protein
LDCVGFLFWAAAEPVFFEAWEKVGSAKAEHKETKTVFRVDQAKRW